MHTSQSAPPRGSSPLRSGPHGFGSGSWLLALLGVLTLVLPAHVQAQRPGATNSLTDVPGLKVGHFQRTDDGFRSGTTVILTEEGATASVDVQGGGPGTKETDLLAPGGLVTFAHGIVLSGGSAYGLDAATGVMRWLEERGVGWPVNGGVVPIVPAAILFDLGRGGRFDARPDADFGYQAAENATVHAVPQGSVGAGTGARYGLGTASVVLPNGFTVAAIVGLNPGGSPVDPRTCLPYGHFLELDGEFGLTPPGPRECPAPEGELAWMDGSEGYENSFNTTIALVATDAPLDQTQAQRMAMIANSGLSRSIRPVHNLGDGDAVFAISTTRPPETLSFQELHQIYNAGADALGRAVVHALLNQGGYCEQHPRICAGR
ncbi:MAG: P1 family peptidase [Gemmatimonadota bacterium]